MRNMIITILLLHLGHISNTGYQVWLYVALADPAGTGLEMHLALIQMMAHQEVLWIRLTLARGNCYFRTLGTYRVYMVVLIGPELAGMGYACGNYDGKLEAPL